MTRHCVDDHSSCGTFLTFNSTINELRDGISGAKRFCDSFGGLIVSKQLISQVYAWMWIVDKMNNLLSKTRENTRNSFALNSKRKTMDHMSSQHMENGSVQKMYHIAHTCWRLRKFRRRVGCCRINKNDESIRIAFLQCSKSCCVFFDSFS